MNTLNDLKNLLLKIIFSVPQKVRVFLPSGLILLVVIFAFIYPSIVFWRQTIGYNLLGFFYFTTMFSILNIVDIQKSTMKRKILKYVLNILFLPFFFLVHRIYTMQTGLLGIVGEYSFIEGISPFIMISFIFLLIVFLLNNKSFKKSLTIWIILISLLTSCGNEEISVNRKDPKVKFSLISKYDDKPINGEVIRYNQVSDGAIDPIYKDGDIVLEKWVFKKGKVVEYYENYPDGTPKVVRNFSGTIPQSLNSNFNGELMEYFEDGSVKKKGSYKEDVRHGGWLVYNENETLISKKTYNNGVLEGDFIENWPNGNLKVKYFSKNGSPDSIYTTGYNNGQVRETSNWKNGRRHDSYILISSSGNKMEEVTLTNGIREGVSIQYFEDGSVYTKSTYKQGRLEGESLTYCKLDGQEIYVGTLGMEGDQFWRETYGDSCENQFPFKRYNYKDGKKHGDNYDYFLDGSFIKTTYDMDRRISESEGKL